ncbi:MAG: hypothetical protein GVY36_17880 [Verrucomicrobia bacterium]|jgi:hypothetical protein|nr:hypothetical protein [Verrucomicrobiota bacterium]
MPAILKKLSMGSLLLVLAGCDSGSGESTTADSVPAEVSKLEEAAQTDPHAHEIDVPRPSEVKADSAQLIRQGVALAHQALPGYAWEGNTGLPLSVVAPEIDELDVMDLLLKFEDHYGTDITMADLSALIGRENIEEARHHLTLESITLLVAAPDRTN